MLVTPTPTISSVIFKLEIAPGSELVDGIISGENQTFAINVSAQQVVIFDALQQDTSYIFKLETSNCGGTQVKNFSQLTRKFYHLKVRGYMVS